MSKKRTIYYYDEQNDDFAGTNIVQKPIKDNFKYIRDKNPIWRLSSFLTYYILVKPLGLFINKIINGSSIKNRKVLRKINRRSGYFLYGNHTSMLSDAFQPSLIKYGKKTYIIANPDVTSIKGIENLVMMLGALPLPNTMPSRVNFIRCVKKRVSQGACITIYPEAHIWPYYTKLRDFSKENLHYPVKLNVPCFTITTCYSKHKGLLFFIKRPKVTSYIDGPFYPDSSLNQDEAEEKLKLQIQEAMKKRLEKYSTYEYINYVKVDDPSQRTISIN